MCGGVFWYLLFGGADSGDEGYRSIWKDGGLHDDVGF